MPLDPATIGLVTSIGSKVLGGLFGNSARKARRRAARARAEIERLRNFQARREFLQKFREAQAASIVRGAAQGVSVESSLIQGELSSQETQARVGTMEQDRMNTLANVANANLEKAGRYNFASDLFSTAGSILDAYPFPTSSTTPVGKGKKNG